MSINFSNAVLASNDDFQENIINNDITITIKNSFTKQDKNKEIQVVKSAPPETKFNPPESKF